MADKEERILITKCSGWCHALRISYDTFDDDDGMYCDKIGKKWVRITEKDCAKCKDPVLSGISRQEAIERMAKAAYYNASTAPANFPDWDKIEDEIGKELKQGFIAFAEAALNSLLEGK